MRAKSKIDPLTVAVMIVVVIGSALATSVTLTATANAAPDKTSTNEGRILNTAYSTHGNSSGPRHWSGTKSLSGTKSWNVITTPTQAQATVAGATHSFTIGGANGGNHNGRNDRHGGIITHHHYNWNNYNWNNYNWNFYNSGVMVTAQLTIYNSGQGVTSPSIGTYSYSAGSVVTVTAYPYGGYALSYWTIDGVNYTPSASVTLVMNYDHTVTAYFTGGP